MPRPRPRLVEQERQFHAAYSKHKELDEIAEIVKTKSLGAVVRFFYLEAGAQPREAYVHRLDGRRPPRVHAPVGRARRARRAPTRCNDPACRVRGAGQKKKQQREK